MSVSDLSKVTGLGRGRIPSETGSKGRLALSDPDECPGSFQAPFKIPGHPGGPEAPGRPGLPGGPVGP